MSAITLGSDPELFFVKDGKFMSAVGLCKGTKDKPFQWRKGFSVHNDNVAVEFNIPPARSKEEWIENHLIALKYVRDIAVENGFNLKIVSDAVFDDDQLQTNDAKEFGCNPDFSAWKLEDNASPKADTNLRTAGGHIHIGIQDTYVKKLELVRLLDIFVGIPLRMLEPDSRRNELYGNIGACRNKPYGIEYRTPSNVWLRSTELMGNVYNMVQRIVQHRAEYATIMARVDDNLDKFLVDKATQKDQVAHVIRDFSGFYSEGLHQHVLS